MKHIFILYILGAINGNTIIIYNFGQTYDSLT